MAGDGILDRRHDRHWTPRPADDLTSVALRDPGLRPQRGRLRGAGRPARGRRLPRWSTSPPTPTRSWSTPAASSRRPRRTRSTRCSPAADLKTDGQAPGRGRGRLPGRAVRRGARRARCPRPTRCSASTTTPTSPTGCASILAGEAHAPAHAAGPPAAAARSPPAERPCRAAGRACPAAACRRRRGWTRPDGAAQAGQRLRPPVHVLRDPDVPRRPSSAAARPTCSPRPGGWPARACASCSWSARTPPPTARTSATCGCSRRCCPSWPPSTASSGCGCPTCSRPRPGPGLVEAIATHAGRGAVLRPVLPARQRRGAAPDAALRRPRALPGPARAGPGAGAEAGVRSNVIVGLPRRDRGRPRRSCATSWSAARLDVIGVFGYSDEDGTEAASFDGKLDDDEIRARVDQVSRLVEELTAQRAEERVGERVEVLVESVDDGDRRGPRGPPGSRGGRHHLAARGRARRSATWCRRRSSAATASTWSPAPRERPDDRSAAHRARRGQQLEPAQRADHAADRDGAVLRLGAARRRRRLGAVAVRGLRALRRRDDHRQDRRRHRPRRATWSPTSARSPTRSPTRRSPGWPSSGSRSSATSGGGSRSSCCVREWSVTLLRLSILKHVVIAAANQRQDQDHAPGGRPGWPDAAPAAGTRLTAGRSTSSAGPLR